MPGGYEWLIIIGVLLLLFGAKKLPDMARSVGQSARVFKGEMKGLKQDEGPKDAEKPAAAPSAPQEVTSGRVETPEARPASQPAPAPAPESVPGSQPQHGRTDAT